MMCPPTHRLTLVALLACLVSASLSTAAGAQGPRRSVWDGVYTDAQAARGKASYDMHCAGCHGNELEGLGFGNGPGLVGQRFVETWEGNLFSLFDMSRSPMPRAEDVTVPDDAVLDALAFILQRNEMPAGMDELRLDALSLIAFVGKDGPTPVRDLALGRVLGCLSEGPNDSWVLVNATEPVKSRDGGESSETELATMKTEALGGASYTLLDVFPPPDEHTGHKVEAKGILIRKTNSLNVTSLQMVGVACE